MTNYTVGNQQGSPPHPRTIFEFAADGITFDEMPEERRKEVRGADSHKDDRDALAEIRTDQLFAQAAGVIQELMSHEDPIVQLKAATEVFRLRAVTLKANKKRQTAESVARRIFDGFMFPSSNSPGI